MAAALSAPASGTGLAPGLDNRALLARSRGFLLFALGLGLCFAWPLVELVRYAAHSELYSHVPLVPVISGYLAWTDRSRLPAQSRSGRGWAWLPLLLGSLLLGGYWVAVARDTRLSGNDSLALTIGAFVCFQGAGALVFLGRDWVRVLAFPLAFLVFLVPMPDVLLDWIVTFFQYTSAAAAFVLLKCGAMPMLYQGLTFQLPGIDIEVAPECSGIHSSLVLFMTSLLGGHLFLRAGWRKTLLAVTVVPLGILRNGFRIFVISMLCVHVSPEMINSPIHHKGGPLFFVLSLIPFFALLLWLRKSEARREARFAASPLGRQPLASSPPP